MKIQFESDLGYQDRAIASIVDIFEGQDVCQSHFSIVRAQTKGKKQTFRGTNCRTALAL